MIRARLLPLLLVSGVALAAPSKAKPAPKAEVPAAPAPVVAIVGADAAEAALSDPSRAREAAAAWTALGDALKADGYAYAALAAYARALEADPHAAAASYPTIVDLTERFDEEAWVGALLGKDFSVRMDEGTRARVALAAARALFARGEWGPALGLVPLVPDADPHHLDAEILRGVLLAQQGRYSDALVPLLTSYEAARDADRDPHEIAALALNIARTFFATGNYGRAMEYDDLVPRSDPYWPEASFERAWAHFRADDMQGAIALLTTHESPFFEDWYFPEAAMLRAQALFLLCKFPEASTSIDAFQARFAPLERSLGTALPGLGPKAAWQDVKNFLAGGPSKLPVPLLRRLRYDQRVADAIAALDVADAELARLGQVSSPWAKRAADALRARADARAEGEGRRVLDRARDAAAELHGMLADLELTKVDMLTYQAQLYTQAAATGELALGDKVGKVRELRRKGKHVWPFEGEYWADELGWYRLDTRSDCPTNLQRGQ